MEDAPAWNDLFERAATVDVACDDVRETLADVREE
jgi:hypothetical protein